MHGIVMIQTQFRLICNCSQLVCMAFVPNQNGRKRPRTQRDRERDRERERKYMTKWLMLKRKPPPQCSLQANKQASSNCTSCKPVASIEELCVLASSNRQGSIASNFFITKFSPNFSLKNTISSNTNWLSRWASHWHI